MRATVEPSAVSGWELYRSPEGLPYYHHAASGQSVWAADRLPAAQEPSEERGISSSEEGEELSSEPEEEFDEELEAKFNLFLQSDVGKIMMEEENSRLEKQVRRRDKQLLKESLHVARKADYEANLSPNYEEMDDDSDDSSTSSLEDDDADLDLKKVCMILFFLVDGKLIFYLYR
jgi:hypothetical protein